MNAEFKLDLHTHSIISHDGGISPRQYAKLLERDQFFYVAVTDHNEISLAQQLRHQLGERIIVGEEIMTAEGEIIGLFLQDRIAPNLSAEETVRRIREQGGLVYIPHPLERFRRGLSQQALENIADQIDIVEVFNARSREPQLRPTVSAWAKNNSIAPAASSDAHCALGLGAGTYVSSLPARDNLAALLAAGRREEVRASALAFLCPSFNRLKKTLHI
jgi:predicted metal-dependent phosphoesterase TrpH